MNRCNIGTLSTAPRTDRWDDSCQTDHRIVMWINFLRSPRPLLNSAPSASFPHPPHPVHGSVNCNPKSLDWLTDALKSLGRSLLGTYTTSPKRSNEGRNVWGVSWTAQNYERMLVKFRARVGHDPRVSEILTAIRIPLWILDHYPGLFTVGDSTCIVFCIR